MNPVDRRLITEVLAGRTESFGELVRRYQDRLYSVALRVVDNSEDAADVVQETFLSAYQSLGNFKGDAELFTWLYRIAFNTAVSHKRKKRIALSLDSIRQEGDSAMDPEDKGADVRPGAAMERSEDERVLAQALSRLSEEHRLVLTMKEIDGLKYQEIADIMDVPVGTMRSRLHRARLELRSLLAPKEIEEPGASTKTVNEIGDKKTAAESAESSTDTELPAQKSPVSNTPAKRNPAPTVEKPTKRRDSNTTPTTDE